VYIPRKFQLTDDQIADFLTSAGLALLVTPGTDGLLVTPLPMIYDPHRNSLVAHLARPNPHWRQVEPGVESVAMFLGLNGYVSPSLYATKAETRKVVPTWNYELVNVYGQLQVHDDPAWLMRHVTSLSDHHEHGRNQPWSVSDAPESFVEGQLRAVVGIELSISRWEGKAKMSQNQPDANQRSVIAGLSASGCARDRQIAETVANYISAGRTSQD
jgi:transcriptional regulator